MKKIKDIGKHLPKVSHELVAKALGVEMNTYCFTIWFDTTESDDDLADKLYEAGCDDALVGVSNGIHCIDFDREAASINEAMKSAIENIISSGLEIRITSITVIPPVQCVVPGCNIEATYCRPDNWCRKHWDEWWNWCREVPEPDWMKNFSK